MRIVFASALVVASLSSGALATGEYLEKGQSGAGLEASLDVGNDANSLGGVLAYSYRGYVDVSVGYARSMVELNVDPKLQYYGNNYLGGVMAHPVKQIAGLPVGLSLGASLMHTTFGGGDLENSTLKMSANGISAGGRLHGTQPINQNISLLVGAGYAWNRVSSKTGSVETSDSKSAFPVSIEGIFNLNGAKAVFGPTLSFFGDSEVLSLNFNLIRPF